MAEDHDPETGEVYELPAAAGTMPPAIAKAIVKVMSSIKQLGYDDRNEFQKYNFASIDRFFAAVGPRCAEAGLFVVMDERDHEIREGQNEQGKKSSWLHITYSLTLYHEGGAAYGPLHRSVIVPAVGAQAFGSAQSFLMKQFLRSLFFIPTGEKDPDADPQVEGGVPANTTKAAPPKQEAPKAPPAGPQGMTADERAKWNTEYNEMRKGIAGCATAEDLNNYMAGKEKLIADMDKAGFKVAAQKLTDSFIARRKVLAPKEPEQQDEEIPA